MIRVHLTNAFRVGQVEFLPPGHTHIDVDGDFGGVSSKLKHHDAWVPADMMQLYQEAVGANADKANAKLLNRIQGVHKRTSRALLVDSVPDMSAVYTHEVRALSLMACAVYTHEV